MINTVDRKLRVGVLMGGKSIEHEVSFNSGRTICDHLDTQCYDVIPIFQTKQGILFILPGKFLHRGKTTDFCKRLSSEAKAICWDDLKDLVDFVYLAIHGRYAEDGIVQGILEVLRIPYLGSDVLASALSMDKAIQKTFLKQAGIDVPHGIVISASGYFKIINDPLILQKNFQQSGLAFPCIVKPAHEGSSLGVSIVYSENELFDAFKHAATISKNTIQSVIIEEKLKGMEFSCIVITDYKTGELIALPATEIVVDPSINFFDYEQKYMPGRVAEYTPPRCDKEQLERIKGSCIRTMQALGITNISRIDGFLTHDNRIVIQDPNTLSGMGPASFLFREAAQINMSHTDIINHLIKTELHGNGLMPVNKFHHQKQENKEKKVIAVLMGGSSNEREISLESGRNVVYKLSPHKYTVVPIFISHSFEPFIINQTLLVGSSTGEIESMLNHATKIRWSDLPNIADFVFIALHGGCGEDGSVQGMLEMLEIPYNSSGVLASSLCMNKYKTSEFLRAHNINTPQSLLILKQNWNKNKEEQCRKIRETFLYFPIIIKPHNDGCSIMVHKINSADEIEPTINAIFADKETLLIEEYIDGMELTVGIIGNGDDLQTFPPSQALVKHEILSMGEKFLPGHGENQTPAPLPQKTIDYVQQVIKKAYTLIGCEGYARIDCFYQPKDSSNKKDRMVILEINTLPALTPATCLFHQAAEVGMKPMDLIDIIIELGFQKHQKGLTNLTQKVRESIL